MSDPVDSLMPHPSPGVLEVMLLARDARLIRAAAERVRALAQELATAPPIDPRVERGFRGGIECAAEWLEQFAANLENPLDPPHPPTAKE